MFRNREIAKTIEFNFIIVIKFIVLPKESYSPFISYNYYSIKNYTWKFQNTFRNGFSSQFVLPQANLWGINIGQKATLNCAFKYQK